MVRFCCCFVRSIQKGEYPQNVPNVKIKVSDLVPVDNSSKGHLNLPSDTIQPTKRMRAYQLRQKRTRGVRMIVNLINFARFRFRQLFGEERDGM